MKAVYFSVFAALLLMVGCAVPQPPPTPTQPPPTAVQLLKARVLHSKPTLFQPKPTVPHQYELLVVDVDGNPLEGVKIEYTLKDRGNIIESSLYTTSSDGLLTKGLSATIDPSYKNVKSYKSEFDFKATKDSYYSKSGSMSSNYGGDNSHNKPVEKDKIILIRPIDYFDKKFATTLSILSTFLCKFFIIPFFKEWQVVTHFSYRV